MGVGATTQSNQYGGLALTGAQLAAVVALELPNSRGAESEADRIGMELAAKAGFDPHAAVTLWDKMGKVGGGDGSSRFDFLSTHPAPAKRMETLAEMVPQMMPFYLDKSTRPTYPIHSALAGGGTQQPQRHSSRVSARGKAWGSSAQVSEGAALRPLVG